MDEVYVDKLKQWIDYDNSITELKQEMAKIVESKKQIEDDVIQYIDNSGLSEVSVLISDGLLKFPTRKVQQNISLKLIRSVLEKYNEEKEQQINIEEFCKFLLSKLETKQKTYIKRDHVDK
jgi:chromosomal replication initiation ATPase DnaA